MLIGDGTVCTSRCGDSRNLIQTRSSPIVRLDECELSCYEAAESRSVLF